MGQKLIIGPITKGMRNDVLPFNIDNDSFPTLVNAYQWRGRVKRKRGTALLGRLSYFLENTSGVYPQVILISPFPISPGVSQFTIGSTILTDWDTNPLHDPVALLSTNPAVSASLNRSTGSLSITGPASPLPVVYYPGLPVLGLEPFVGDPTSIPEQVAFDTRKAYNIPLTLGAPFYGVSFYNNPSATPYLGYTPYPGYTQKTSWTPLNWNLQNYQQMWTTNYQGSMWAVPGFPSPFTTTNIGMQFKNITGFTIGTAGNGTTVPAVATLTIVSHGLVQGDFLFLNEIQGITGANFETCYVTSADPQAANTVTVTFPKATLGGVYTASTGIAQYLTNNSDTSKDCIRWYNGSPVSAANIAPSVSSLGWVNFCPPLTSGTPGNFSISDLPPSPTPYYLVGAKMAVPFKDRLIFFGPVVQTSTGIPAYLPDTIIYSQNGTPYYTASFPYSTENPTIPDLVQANYFPMLLPNNQTGVPYAWWENATGFGGFLNAGYARPITTVSINEDALIVGFTDRQTRLLYTGNDIVPFNFYVINSELGSDSTFSSITLDRGVITFGGRGIVLTSQVSSQRIDLEIPDQLFQITGSTQSARSVCAQRDFINEWIHFTYQYSQIPWNFPNQTLQYNYREGTWAVFNESYTTYGTIRLINGLTWATVGLFYPTWASWTVPWNSSINILGQPLILAGNAQGFVVIKGVGTNEANSLFIQNVNPSTSTITSPNHCLNNGDYIVVNNVQGTLSSQMNGKIFQINNATTNTFNISPLLTTGTYLGGGTIQRMYIPYIQSKQFPVSWEMARKTRIGVQQYLFTNSQVNNSQVSLLIFLSQNSSSSTLGFNGVPYNDLEYPNPPILVPATNGQNNALIYSTVIYTCPESTNLGLTPSNINLQMLTASQQQQIWHRMNTSLIGDTVQIGITLNSEQMTDPLFANQFSEIELHSAILDLNPSSLLA